MPICVSPISLLCLYYSTDKSNCQPFSCQISNISICSSSSSGRVIGFHSGLSNTSLRVGGVKNLWLFRVANDFFDLMICILPSFFYCAYTIAHNFPIVNHFFYFIFLQLNNLKLLKLLNSLKPSIAVCLLATVLHVSAYTTPVFLCLYVIMYLCIFVSLVVKKHFN